MINNFSLFLALRYLKPKRTFVSIITLISILGPILGVGTLIVTISIMTGFEKELKKVILGFEPHITVNNDFLDSEIAETDWWKILKNDVNKLPNVLNSSVFVEGLVVLEATDDNGITRRFSPLMRGMPTSPKDYQFQQLGANMDDNKMPELDDDDIVISNHVAINYGIKRGQKIRIISGHNAEEVLNVIMKKEDDDGLVNSQDVTDIINEMIVPKELTVKGFFNQVRYDNYVFVPLHIAQELYNLENDVHGFSIYLKNPYDALTTQKLLSKILPKHLNSKSYSWMEKYSREFNAIRNERSMMYLVLFVILIVSAFCIMNTLITITMQKKSEIGVCKAIGANDIQIMNIFLFQGLIVGLIGTFLGFIGGLWVIIFRNQIIDFFANIGFELFPSDIYGLNSIPALIVWKDVSIICIGSIVLCVSAAIIPAYMVSRLNAATALRNK